MLWESLSLAVLSLSVATPPPMWASAQAASSIPSIFAQSVQRTARFNEADRLKFRADDLLNAGDIEGALQLYKRAADLFRAELGERHPITLSTNNNYATALERAGRIAEAARLYERIFRIRQADLGDRNRDTINSAINYGFILNALGRTSEAEPIYAKAAEDARLVLGEDHPLTLGALNNYAAAISTLGRPERALPIYRKILQTYTATLGERDPRTLNALNNVGTALLGLKRFEEALPVLDKTQRLTREARGRTQPETLTIVSNYAFALVQLGRFEEGAKLTEEVWRTRRRVLGERHPDTLFSQNNYAFIQTRLGRNARAEALIEQAFRNHAELFGPSHPSTLSDLASLTTLLIANRKNEAALTRSRELVRRTRSRAFELSQGGLGEAQQFDLEAARRRSIERQHADALWPSYLRAPSPVDIDLGEEAFIALQRATAGSASNAVTQAAAARFAHHAGLSELFEERQSLERDWALIESALVQNQGAGPQAARLRDQKREELERIEARVAQIDARLSGQAPQFFAILKQSAVDFDQMIAALGEDEAVMLIVPSRFGTNIMTLSREYFRWERSTLKEDEVNEAVAELREGLEIAPGEAYLPFFDLELAHRLYTQLFAPVEESIKYKSRVYLIADGALSRLPLGVLVSTAPSQGADADDPEVLRGTDWLGDRYALVQLPSVQSLVYLRQYTARAEQAGEGDFVGFGAPVLEGAGSTRSARSATLTSLDASGFVGELRGSFGAPLMDPQALRKLAALPGTRGELEQVRQALGAPESALFLDERMTEGAIRTADLSRTRVLHLATHGFTSEESGAAAEPGLVFTPPLEARPEDDGYLAASEVLGLDLSLAEWVILSACNTASPSGNLGETGLSGLAQAFLYAGAQSLLVSHWPVFDDIAPVLTVEMLKRVKAGTPRAEALQAAIREVRGNLALEAAHPAVWAPFTLVGEGR